MIHTWNSATDGNGATVRVVLFDFKKAFDLIDHRILVGKLCLYDIPDHVISWIIDFLTSPKQRVLTQNGVLYRRGFPKAHNWGPWLFIIMINELDVLATYL